MENLYILRSDKKFLSTYYTRYNKKCLRLILRSKLAIFYDSIINIIQILFQSLKTSNPVFKSNAVNIFKKIITVFLFDIIMFQISGLYRIS